MDNETFQQKFDERMQDWWELFEKTFVKKEKKESPEIPKGEMISTREAVILSGVSRASFYNYVRDGIIKKYYFLKKPFYSKEEITSFKISKNKK